MNEKEKESWRIIVESCRDNRHSVSVSTLNRRAAIIAIDREYAHRGLALATLCDMLLGEDAEDRSNEALIRRARELVEQNKLARGLLSVMEEE